jgi:TonB family protein
MTRHSQSSTRLDAQRAAQRTANVLSLLDERARSRRRWAFVLALCLNVLVWKAIASLPQATGRAGSSSGAIEWSRVEINPLPSTGAISRSSAPAAMPKSVASATARNNFSPITPRSTREPQTRTALPISPAPKLAPQRPKLPQRASSVVPETLPMRHNPDLETPMTPQENRQEQSQANATPDLRSTTSQSATWTTPKTNPISSATSTKARTDNALPLAGQTPSSSGNAAQAANAQAAKKSGGNGALSTRSAGMTAAPSPSANSSADSGHRNGADFASGFRDGSSRNGSSNAADAGESRGDAKSEGGNLGERSRSRMSAPDARMRELPDFKSRSEPSRTPRPKPRATPREESRPVAAPRPQPQETPRRVEERPQPTPETTRTIEKPRRSIEVREAQADHIVKPRVPRRLRREKRRLSVGLDVDVDESGRATPRLRESSGDSELDEEALKAARKTRWKPRAEDGKATKSTQRMRYDVDVKDGAGNDNGDEEGDSN